MKYLYKINSSYDGFTPARIEDRMTDGLLRLGWTRYLDEVVRSDEVWVHFRGPHRFAPGVYAKGRVVKVNRPAEYVLIKVKDHAESAPLTTAKESARIEDIVSVPYRQVFLLPEDWETVSDCSAHTSASSCREHRCDWCPTWRGLPIINSEHFSLPRYLLLDKRCFVPAYWAIPSRCYLPHRRINSSIRRFTHLFMAFKMGNGNLSYPLALGMLEALREREVPLNFDCIVPIPLSPDKVAKKEINRTRLLATELSQLLEAPVADLLLLRAPVSKRRLLNDGFSYGAFLNVYRSLLQAAQIPKRFRRILLVDDVCTYGGTLRASCEALVQGDPGIDIVASTAAQMILKAVLSDESAVA